MSSSSSSPSGVLVLGPQRAGYSNVLSDEALLFLKQLHTNFEHRRRALLAARRERSVAIDKGEFPTFLPETAWIRQGSWRAASLAPGLIDRRVELTGPVDRKMIINALNSGAKVFLADFEDATSPTWDNLISGQINLIDAVRRTITFSQQGKSYQLKSSGLATLMVRPRGWHLEEHHVLVDGEPMSASLFDFGLYFFHNAVELVRRGLGPYFYLPKMESHKEARLWNDVFVFAQQRVGLPTGTIRATVLIETILAGFEMDEIIYELRAHSAGLNCGRWDYIFNFIKKFKNHPQFVLPDRAHVGMTAPFMANYVRLLIATCHRRGVHAMGGMAAFIPVSDPVANKQVLDKVRQDKLREVLAGHDGTWVAHPGLIPTAVQVFDAHMKGPNQLDKPIESFAPDAKDLITLQGVTGGVSLNGVNNNLDVSLDYLEAWLRGNGCVPLHNLMEDAATAEIARSQIWQWMKHKTITNDGQVVDKILVEKLFNQILQQKKAAAKGDRKYDLAAKLLKELLFAPTLHDFLTSLAYPHIVTAQTKARL